MDVNFSYTHLSAEDKQVAFLERCTEFDLVRHRELRDEVRSRLGI